MTKAYRHPYNRKLQPDRFTRPEMPMWLQQPHNFYSVSWRYWTKMYWATPPWLTDKQVEAMKDLHLRCSKGFEVDHIVPLKSSFVCGLNVPWNLRRVPKHINQQKSNNHWPDHPNENHDLFGHEAEQYQLLGA